MAGLAEAGEGGLVCSLVGDGAVISGATARFGPRADAWAVGGEGGGGSGECGGGADSGGGGGSGSGEIGVVGSGPRADAWGCQTVPFPESDTAARSD
jgi:hypothetical protein